MRLTYAALAILILCMPTSTLAKKAFEFYPEISSSFFCEKKQYAPGEHQECRVIPPKGEQFVEVVVIDSFACKGPLDIARIKKGDFLYSIDGTKVKGLKTKDFLELVRKAAEKPSSVWTIVRISESGRREVFETSVTPMEERSDADYESCGETDPET